MEDKVKLKTLVKGIPDLVIKGSKEIEITGVCAHSKQVAPGNLFVVKKGLTRHGASFIPEALAAGACALLTDMYDPFLEDVVQLIHPDVASVEAELAARYYHFSSDELFLIGITGTNGKTTSAYLVKHLFDRTEQPCGLIGTVEWIVGSHSLPPTHTTPDLLTNQKLFYEMRQQGAAAAVMEVSSQALDQQRVRGIDFDCAVFTNLTQDHLDYHKTMEEYAAAKAKLFSSLRRENRAVVNADSPWLGAVVKQCPASLLTYGIEQKADVSARGITLTPHGTTFTVHYQGEARFFASPLIGKFNVYNALAAIGVGLSCALPLEKILRVLETFKSVPGRLQKVANPLGLSLFVDYAHTEDALKNVLQTLRESGKGRLITVFGCGGNRDPHKRPKMGAVAEELSDQVVITNDNPRNEDPEAIAQQILSGFKNPNTAHVELDRRVAIRRALQLAKEGDLILIAGKGHENCQIFAHQTFPFDDAQVAFEEAARFSIVN